MMDEHMVRFLPDDITVKVDEGTTVLETAQRIGIEIASPCGGRGLCHKCKVRISIGDEGRYEEALACEHRVTDDITVRIPEVESGHNLMTEGSQRQVAWDPSCRCVEVVLPEGSIGDYEDDSLKLRTVLSDGLCRPADEIEVPLDIMRDLEVLLADGTRDLHAVVVLDRVVRLSDVAVPVYMAAFDIGTTSVVGYLLDGKDGRQIAVTSRLNPQTALGEDVISRANYAVGTDHGALTQMIRAAVDEMLGELATSAGISKHDIYLVSVVGNTCMHHLFLGLLPSSLIAVPYNASVSEAMLTDAAGLGLDTAVGGCVLTLPIFAGFVGADTDACLIDIDFINTGVHTLMIDIGTNGELVMGDGEAAFCCSTAAGPALEGARILFGMRGATGAIDHASAEGDEMVLSVIGGGKAQGICGSGIIDIIALLLDTGMVDSRGRMLKPERLEGPFAKANAWRYGRDDGGAYLNLVDGVRITQRDIREVQLAKSAIAVGIRVLCRKLGWKLDDIERILIAGAFGSYMDPASACRIGLLPGQLRDRVASIGNAAGEGAKIVLMNRGELDHGRESARRIPFIELATENDFQALFVENLDFRN